jgi:hypothetical protein
MGADNHPTVDVSDEPDKVYSVIDRRDKYHPHTVGNFSNESAADKLKEQLIEKRQGPSTMPEDRWFVVRDVPIFDSADEWENHET